jgi:hypothetical protein
MSALEKLYTAQDRWRDLLDVYEMMLNVKTEPAQQLVIYGRIALIQEEELGDRTSTIDTFRKMLMVDAANAPAVRALERLYRDGEPVARPGGRLSPAPRGAPGRPRAHPGLHAAWPRSTVDRCRIRTRAIDNLTPILAIDARNLRDAHRPGRTLRAGRGLAELHRRPEPRGAPAHRASAGARPAVSGRAGLRGEGRRPGSGRALVQERPRARPGVPAGAPGPQGRAPAARRVARGGAHAEDDRGGDQELPRQGQAACSRSGRSTSAT